MASRWHLAQINIAKLLKPEGDPSVQEFFDNLDRVNALAEQSDGFIWRLKDDNNNATSIQIFDRDDLLVNMSMWESVEALRAYVISDKHMTIMRRRAEWFFPPTEPTLVLWWQAVDKLPTVQLAESKLKQLRKLGPSPQAFDFKTQFPPP